MKFLFDLSPVILFFIAFKLAGIYVATGVAIAATFAQILWLWLRKKTIEPMLWVSLVIIVLFGGATLIFQNETFIKWKPSVLYWAFSLALAAAQLFAQRNLIQSMLGKQLILPQKIWGQLLWAWCAFFFVMGVLNLWVAYHFDTEQWVNFKLFGGTGLMFVFVIAQALYMGRYLTDGHQQRPEP